MNRHLFIPQTTFLLFLLVIPAAFAQTTGVGGPYGEYHLTDQGPETLTLLVIPDGSGGALDQAFLPLGNREDATITLFLRDAFEDPVAFFPAEDLWLESEDGGLARCVGGTIADAYTDTDGRTQWLNPLFGGGHSQALTVVKVNGTEVEYTTGVNLSFNSPDINGDLSVDAVDLQTFVEDYFSGYDFRSDFHRDGVLNGGDLVVMTEAYGACCP
jgi:hypothetical protein